MTSLLPALRQVAPRLTRQFFQCSHRLPRVATRPDLFKEASPRYVRAFKSSARRVSSAVSGNFAPETDSSSSSSSLSKRTGQNGKRKTRFFPNTSEKPVAYWLLGSAASVFGIVVFGGLTRLTESGYIALFLNGWKDANCSKPKYYRMEASHRQPTPNNGKGLGVRVQ